LADPSAREYTVAHTSLFVGRFYRVQRVTCPCVLACPPPLTGVLFCRTGMINSTHRPLVRLQRQARDLTESMQVRMIIISIHQSNCSKGRRKEKLIRAI